MPELTTIDGITITFNSVAVAVIADDTGTCVYGITSGELRIAEPIDVFLNRLGILQAFAKLTRPDGAAVWIRGTAVLSIDAPFEGEYIEGVKTVITTVAVTQGVAEPPDEVQTLIDARGGVL
jgi:hypothetical protein